jgi:hypothetical protein
MKAIISITAACFALALAGCGGDGDSEADAEFIGQVNAVCAEYGPKLELIPPPAQDIDEWAAIGADMGDLLETSVNELRALVPTEELEQDFRDWLDLRTEMVTALRDTQDAGGLHDVAGVEQSLGRLNDAMATADPLAVQLGFDQCAPTGIDTGGELPEER